MLLDFSLAARAAPRPAPADPQSMKIAIENRLRALSPAEDDKDQLAQAIRYALVAPGKRIRPLLTMLVAQEFGADAFDALDAGCALEMAHAASLVLDDLPAMDDSPDRRGQPATHIVFGEDIAVLASVTLLSRAYAAVASAAELGAEARCALVGVLARAVGTDGLARGQYQDLRAALMAPDQIADTNHLKTGMLFVAAVEMAAVVANAPAHHCERMRSVTTHLGQAFQILDDLSDGPDEPLDAEPAAEPAKTTLLSLLGRNETQRRLQRHLAFALEPLKPDGALARFVLALFEDDAPIHSRSARATS